MTVSIPVRLVTEHTATISAMLLGGARSVLPFVKKSQGGVRINRLSERYYAARFEGAKSVLD